MHDIDKCHVYTYVRVVKIIKMLNVEFMYKDLWADKGEWLYGDMGMLITNYLLYSYIAWGGKILICNICNWYSWWTDVIYINSLKWNQQNDEYGSYLLSFICIFKKIMYI